MCVCIHTAWNKTQNPKKETTHRSMITFLLFWILHQRPCSSSSHYQIQLASRRTAFKDPYAFLRFFSLGIFSRVMEGKRFMQSVGSLTFTFYFLFIYHYYYLDQEKLRFLKILLILFCINIFYIIFFWIPIGSDFVFCFSFKAVDFRLFWYSFEVPFEVKFFFFLVPLELENWVVLSFVSGDSMESSTWINWKLFRAMSQSASSCKIL